MEGTIDTAAAAGRAVELYADKKEAGEEGEKSLSTEDVSLSLEQADHGLSTRARGNDETGRRRSMARSKDKSRDEKSTYGQAILPLPDMTVLPMGLSYPNDHLEDHEGYRHVTRPDSGLELTDHASIPTVRTPEKIPPWDHSDRFDDEGPRIDPKDDTEGKKPVVDGNQDSVSGSTNCYNGSAQLVQLKQLTHHHEEAGTGVASLSTPQYKELLIDTSNWCLPLHIELTLRKRIVDRLARKKMQDILRVAQKTLQKIHMEKVYRTVMGSHPPQNQFCWSHRQRNGS